jgi:hypothetical protein
MKNMEKFDQPKRLKQFIKVLWVFTRKQFDEIINLADDPIKNINFSAAILEVNRSYIQRTGSEESYESTNNFHLSVKNLICQSKNEKKTEDMIINSIQVNRSTTVSDSSIQSAHPIQSKEYFNQFLTADNLTDNPTQLMDFLEAVPELNSNDSYRTESAKSYDLEFYTHLTGKNLICQEMRSKNFEDIMFSNLWL